MILSIRSGGKAARDRGAPRRAGQRAHGVIPACRGWGDRRPRGASHVRVSCVNRWQPWGQAHPDMRQGTEEVHHAITDALLPQADLGSCTLRQRCTRTSAATGGPRAIAGTAREATPSTGHSVMTRLSQEAPSSFASRRHDEHRVGAGVWRPGCSRAPPPVATVLGGEALSEGPPWAGV
jgi:hypothetical protein